MPIRAFSLIALCCPLAAQSPQIYSSGPIVTNPGAAMNGGNLSALQVQGATPFFMTTIGHGAWRSNPNSTLELGIVDAFATNGTWSVDGLQFYCYQTGVSLPSISGVYVEIYSGDPAIGGQPIAGSPGLANNLFTTPGYQVGNVMTNVYRASLATPADGTRQIQAVRIVLPAPLVLDPAITGTSTYWIRYEFESATSASGPWVPPISILGSPDTGRAQLVTTQFGVVNWAPLEDPGSPLQPVPYRAGAPFVLYGTASSTPGGFTSLNGGCSSAGLTMRGAPHVGGVVYGEIVNSGANVIPLIGIGFSDPNLPFGLCACTLHSSFELLFAPATTFNWQVPLMASAVGLEFYVQGDQLDFTNASTPALACNLGTGFRFALTNAFRVRLY